MSLPLVSVIIPVYNQAEYLGEAVQSVLDQTYPHFEILVVDDASPDHTNQVIRQYTDPRLKYLVHEQNRMLAAARNTGIRASRGDIIVLLDADDVFHPAKLQAHVEFLDAHRDIGVSYNARFDVGQSTADVLDLWRPPLTIDLADLVLGFPFAPSDMVLRREWIHQVGLFDESYTQFGEDLDINCRLALAGCRFASVDRALNYRRKHPGRVTKNAAGRLAAHLRALDLTFTDPRCPADVIALRKAAFVTKYLSWACIAFGQDETMLGQSWIRQAAQIDPVVLEGKPCRVVQSLLDFSMTHGSQDHDACLGRVFAQLPPEMEPLAEQQRWAVQHAHLLEGVRAVLWGDPGAGDACFARAREMGAKIDRDLAQSLAYELSSFEVEFGPEAGRATARRMAACLAHVADRRTIGRIEGCYSAHAAFASYRAGTYARVPVRVLNAMVGDPRYLRNRGLFSILARSLWNVSTFRANRVD